MCAPDLRKDSHLSLSYQSSSSAAPAPAMLMLQVRKALYGPRACIVLLVLPHTQIMHILSKQKCALPQA